MNNQTCGNCRHWLPFGKCGDKRREIEGFGTCGNAAMHSGREDRTVVQDWQFCVIDGSDYFASLKTRGTFGCTEWSAGSPSNEGVVDQAGENPASLSFIERRKPWVTRLPN